LSGIFQKNGSVRVLVRAQIPVEGVGKKLPSGMDEIPCPYEHIQGIAFDELGAADIVVQQGIIGYKKPATGHTTASLCL
jgi:hypothetical protein